MMGVLRRSFPRLDVLLTNSVRVPTSIQSSGKQNNLLLVTFDMTELTC